MADNAPYIVGICGPSGAGKTYLIEHLSQRFSPNQLTVISQDHYYRDDSELERDEEGMINYDHPRAMNLERLVEDIQTLQAGKAVEIPQYFYRPTLEAPAILRFAPAPILLVEGIFTLHYPPLVDLLSLKVFVEAPEALRLERRVQRDQQERGYSREEILKNYEKYVAPMYTQFVEPCKGKSDLIVSNHQDIHQAVELLAQRIESALQKNC